MFELLMKFHDGIRFVSNIRCLRMRLLDDLFECAMSFLRYVRDTDERCMRQKALCVIFSTSPQVSLGENASGCWAQLSFLRLRGCMCRSGPSSGPQRKPAAMPASCLPSAVAPSGIHRRQGVQLRSPGDALYEIVGEGRHAHP